MIASNQEFLCSNQCVHSLTATESRDLHRVARRTGMRMLIAAHSTTDSPGLDKSNPAPEGHDADPEDQ